MPRLAPAFFVPALAPALASVLALSLSPACGGSSPSRTAEAPAAPAAPAAVGIAQFTVTAAPDRVLPAMAWYPAQQPGAAAPPILGRKLPVLAMSHGLGGRKEHAAHVAERAAAAGYLVVAVDHVNDGPQNALQRPLDIAKLLDRLAARGAEPAWLAELADLEHVAVYGHSFGGYTGLALAGAKIGPNPEWTALCAATPAVLGCPAPTEQQMPTASLRDRRVDAVVAAAPAGFFQFGRAGTAATEAPVVLIAAGKDRLTTAKEYVRPLFEHMKQPRWYLELEHANHFTFIDLCPVQDKLPPQYAAEVAEGCGPDAPVPMQAAHALIADTVVAALDHLLKGGPAPDLAALAKARGIAARAEAAR
jgi:predicted dienelactone hydrolase